jgi:putative transposase
MPEHVHLLLIPGTGAATIGAILKGIKRPFSFRIKCALQAAKSPLLDELTIRQRPSIETFRYWQEGPGYDRNLDRAATVMAAIDYIHLNPVRRGLVARTIEWLWSSARWYDGIPNDGQIHFPRLAKLPMEFLLPTPR